MKPSKIFLLAALAVAAFTLGAFAQVTYTRQTARVTRFQCDPTYDSGGAVTAAKVNAFLVQRLVNNADATDVRTDATPKQVDFDLLDAALTSTNITAAGKTVTYPQLAALMRQACLDRANAAGVQ